MVTRFLMSHELLAVKNRLKAWKKYIKLARVLCVAAGPEHHWCKQTVKVWIQDIANFVLVVNPQCTIVLVTMLPRGVNKMVPINFNRNLAAAFHWMKANSNLKFRFLPVHKIVLTCQQIQDDGVPGMADTMDIVGYIKQKLQEWGLAAW